MSLRETKLCDTLLHNWNNNPVTCGELAIATCALCSSDVCEQHALHPMGGVLLRCDSIIPGPAGATQDVIYAPGSGQATSYPQVNWQNVTMIRLQVCAGCRKSFNDNDIMESLRALEKPFVKMLAAAITAKALETK